MLTVYTSMDELEKTEEKLHNIVSELESLFDAHKDLNELVEAQQKDLDIIENSISSAKDNVNQGASELDKADTYLRKARKKKICLCATLLIIFCILILIIVLATN